MPDAVKQRYLEAALDGTVVSTRVDGMPHRVLRTGLVEKLESGSPLRGLSAAVAQRAEVQEDDRDDVAVDDQRRHGRCGTART